MSKCNAFCWLLVLLLAMPAPAGAAETADRTPNHVLLIFSGQRDVPAERLIEEGLRAAFVATGSDPPLRMTATYLDMFERYDPDMARLDAERLRRRLAVKGMPDLVITMAAAAARFVADHRDIFPPSVKIAAIGPEVATRPLQGPLTQTFTINPEVVETIRLARGILPDTRRVLVIAGNGEADRHLLAAARSELAGMADDLRIEYLTDFKRGELLDQVSTLPTGTILLMVSATRDVSGRPLLPPVAFTDAVARRASVPMFCVFESLVIDSACIGGVVILGPTMGREIGKQAYRMLRSEGPFEPVVALSGRPLLKGSAMERWNLPEEDVAEGVEIIDSKPNIYRRYRSAIWITLGVIGAQGISIVALVLALRNSSRHRNRVRELQKRWAFALESAGHGVWDWDIANGQHFFSRGWREIIGQRTQGSGDRRHCRDLLIHLEDKPDVDARLAEAIDQRVGQYQTEHRMLHSDGRMLWVLERGRVVERADDGRALRLIATLEDVTARRTAAEQIEYLATHDALTGLPNRTLLADRIERAISRARRQGHKVAVIFLDLDHFKQVNDTLGHHIGDLLLVAVAGRLMPHLREADTVSRQGGDEFVVLLPELAEASDAALVCDKLMRELADPVQFDGHELRISASMGIALFPDDGNDRETLLQKADVALYRVKDSGRRGYRFFSADMNAELNDLIGLDARLSAALAAGWIQLWYQPQYDLASGELCGVEALMRWIEPDGETIPPGRFIPVAEQFGQIHELGEFALRTACAEARRWQSDYNRAIPVAVNLSAVQFRRPGLTEMLEGILAETGLPPFLLILEITESVIMEDERQTQQTLRALANAGARLAIDDFGTGYSSLAYLKRFPVHHLKIDRAFVKDLGRDPDDEVIVRTIIQLGHSLGLQIVAEGVETHEQSRILLRHGCDFAQGFLYGRPEPAASFRHRLAEPQRHDA